MNRERDRLAAIEKANEILKNAPVYLDTETTGFGPTDEVIDIAVIGDNGNVLFDSLVRPTTDIPYEASRIHHITNSMVANAPDFASIFDRLMDATRSKVVAIYNEEFDIRLLRQTARKHGIPWSGTTVRSTCVMELYARYYGDWSDYHRSYTWQSLENAGKQMSINLPNSHRAKDDALLARAVVMRMASLSVEEPF